MHKKPYVSTVPSPNPLQRGCWSCLLESLACIAPEGGREGGVVGGEFLLLCAVLLWRIYGQAEFEELTWQRCIGSQQQHRRWLTLQKKKKKKKERKKKSLKPVCRKEPLCKAFIMAELLSKWLSGNHQSFLKGIQWFPDRRKKKLNHLCLRHILLSETLKTPMEKFRCSWHGNVWEILRRPDVNLHRPKVSAGGGKKLTFKKKHS